MEDEIKDTLIHCEKEKEIKFNLSFKWTLGISIVLLGVLSLSGIYFFAIGIVEKIWITHGVNIFLKQSLVITSVIVCFIALINIAVVKKPFSKVLIWCARVIGILFILSAFTFPHIAGYNSNFVILSNGKFTLLDGTTFLIGVIVVLFSKIIQFGFLYQNNSDMTV